VKIVHFEEKEFAIGDDIQGLNYWVNIPYYVCQEVKIKYLVLVDDKLIEEREESHIVTKDDLILFNAGIEAK
jgi:hypothetical protein